MDVGDRISISDAVQSLRAQITDAVDAASGAQLTFDVEKIELELQLTVTTAARGEVKGGLWGVVTLGSGLDRSSAVVHKVKLVLEPKQKGRTGRVPISDSE